MTAPGRSAVACRAMTLREVRRVERIDSAFETDRVYRLEPAGNGGILGWSLREEMLARPFGKRYDSGRVDDWLNLYSGSSSPDDFRFLAGTLAERVEGLLTWQDLTWNNTVWLVDLRTRSGSRRQGVASALVGRLKQIARQRKARGIAVETQTNNYPAICFYRKHGFEIAGFNDHLYTNEDLRRQDIALFLFWEAIGSGS